MNRLLDEIMANPEPGHDAISNKLQRLGLPTQTAGHSYEQMNTLKKTAAHDAGLGTITGATVGTIGGGYLGNTIAKHLTDKKMTRVLATIGSAIAGGVAGGAAGYALDAPKDTPTGLSWAQEHGKGLTAAGLGAVGALLGGEGARLFGDSENPVYVNLGRALGGGAGLVAGYALANDVLDQNALNAWKDSGKGKDLSPEDRRQAYVDFASTYANQKGNSFGGQMLQEIASHPVWHGIGPTLMTLSKPVGKGISSAVYAFKKIPKTPKAIENMKVRQEALGRKASGWTWLAGLGQLIWALTNDTISAAKKTN